MTWPRVLSPACPVPITVSACFFTAAYAAMPCTIGTNAVR